MAKSYAQTVLADNPSVYLRFEETAGASCADTTANGLTGTAHGTFSRNVAMGLAGIDIGVSFATLAANNVQIPNNALLNAVKPVTYEIWWNTAQGIPDSTAFMGKGATVTTTADGWSLFVFAGGILKAQLSSAGTVAVATGAGAVSSGALFHIVFTKDSSDNNTIYVNGVQSATANNATVATSSSEPFTVGGTSLGGTVSFPVGGIFDEFALYPTALSAGQVAAHYAARNTAVSASPAIQKPPPPSVVARVRKPHPPHPGPQTPPSPQPGKLPEFIEGERRKNEGSK